VNTPALDAIINTPCRDLSEPKGTTKRREWCMPGIVCADGTRLSVQASRTHYCAPRDNNGMWHAVEVGFPSIAPPVAWAEYAEEWDKPTETVYGYVPVELVREFIEDHGGEAIAPALTPAKDTDHAR
jgi:hypothetical protein